MEKAAMNASLISNAITGDQRVDAFRTFFVGKHLES